MNGQADKFDNGKPQISLIPFTALIHEARVMEFGAAKYGRDNWREGMDWTRLIDATLRHTLAFNDGETYDPESSILHVAHARCNLAMLTEYIVKELGRDDRARRQGLSNRLQSGSPDDQLRIFQKLRSYVR